MITKYDVLYEKNNIVLIVNLDFNYEIADFNFKGFSKNLKDEINTIVKRVKANKIKIIMNGILISTLLISPISLKDDYSKEIKFITNDTIKDSFNEISFKEPDKKDEDILIIDVSKPNKEINETISNNINIHNLNDNKTSKTEEIKKEETPTKTEVIKNDSSSNVIKDTVKEESNEKIDNNIYVTINRSNGSIVKLELEEYLIGVVGSEMPASFNIEALKAQAVVARTYALKRISQGKILTDTTNTQVYKDNNQLKNIWKDGFDKYYNKVKNAVISTKGMVLVYNNNYIDAVYHSTSNGMTEDAIHVWGYDIPYLKSVESKTDVNVSSYKRDVTYSLEKLSNILNTTITKDTTFILERNTSGRVSNVKINDIEIKGTTFRSLLGLRSTDFVIELSEDTAKITTYGFGHGVGMSQYGAEGMANKGYSFKDILSHYYQNTIIKNI